MDIDDTEKNPFDTGAENPGYDETGEINEMDRFPSSSSRRGSKDINNPHHRTYEETSFGGDISEVTPLLTRRENELNASVDEIKRKFPNADTSKFISKIYEYGRAVVRLIREKGKYHLLFNSDGEVNEKLPKTIIKALGTPAEDIIRIKEEISRREKKIQELNDSRETASEIQKEQIDADIEEQQNEISRLDAENERIEERMSLRDRVKLIFKKYGFTVFAVVSAVGLVIGVVVNNLKKGLTSLGKGVGGALKNIGKKIGEILPGMIGAIASFVFKTAGEAVGFLAKNAWLLILAAVMFMIEKFKRNNR